jgi:hypothetical protein
MVAGDVQEDNTTLHLPVPLPTAGRAVEFVFARLRTVGTHDFEIEFSQATSVGVVIHFEHLQ